MDLNNWVLVCTSRDYQRAMTYLHNYKKIGPQLGINVAHPREIQLRDDRTESYINEIRQAVNPDVSALFFSRSSRCDSG